MRASVVPVLLLLAALPSCRRASQRETEAEPAVPVIVERVRLGNIRGTVSATGFVSTLPGATFAVVSPQPARIAEVTKNVGDPVKSGEVLVRFEFPSLRAQTVVDAAGVKAAELRVQQARLAQSRLNALVTQGAASRSEMDDAERELATAEGELLTAKAARDGDRRRKVREHGSPGALRRHGHRTAAQRGRHRAARRWRCDSPADRSETGAGDRDRLGRRAGRFVVGASARAVAEGAAALAAYRGPISATAAPVLLRVLSRPTPEVGARTVEITLAFETPTELQPGTQVGVEIDAEQRSNVPLVPAIAVLKDDPKQPVVVVAAGNVAERRPVVIGLVDAENIEILSGLKSGELIITQGHTALRDGTPISVSAP